MNEVDRRTFLTTTAAVAGSAVLSRAQAAAPDPAAPAFDDAVAVLYDATKCIGCRSCMRHAADSCQSADEKILYLIWRWDGNLNLSRQSRYMS